MSKIENYWFNDISNTIFNIEYYNKIIPNKNMSYPEKMNSFIRLTIYIGIIFSLLLSNYLFLYIPILSMLLTYILYVFRLPLNNKSNYPNYNFSNDDNNNSNFININNNDEMNNECIKPTLHNPFMNPLLFDKRTRTNACNIFNQQNQLNIEKEYNKFCYRDMTDVWNTNNGFRQFYTVPNTHFPNNQSEFANWLYKREKTCKEGNGEQCVANLPNRYSNNLITPGFTQ